jgi:hypothetical protein
VELLIALGIFSLSIAFVLVILRQSVSRVEHLQVKIFSRLHAERMITNLPEHKEKAFSAGPVLQCESIEEKLLGFSEMITNCTGPRGKISFNRAVPFAAIDWGEI